MKKYLILLLVGILTFCISCSNEDAVNKENSKIEEEVVDKNLLFEEDYKKAKDLISEGKLEEGKLKIEELIKSNPKNPKYYFTYGNAFRKEGKLEKALENFKKSLELDSTMIEVYNNMAGIYMLNKDYEKAIETINKALELDNNNNSLKFKKGQLLFVQEKYEETIKIMNVLKDDELYFDAYRFIGLSNMNLNNNKAAIENFEIYIKKAPEELPIRDSIAELLKKMKNKK